jgi:hypothetical protein
MSHTLPEHLRKKIQDEAEAARYSRMRFPERIKIKMREKGMHLTLIYEMRARYNNIIDRCYNPKNVNYHQYGGRGVKVCDEWKNDRYAFVEWLVDNNFSADLVIDKDKKGDGLLYSPETCSFLTYAENNLFTRNSRKIEYNGEVLNLCELSKRVGMHHQTLSDRLDLCGGDVEKALAYKRKSMKGVKKPTNRPHPGSKPVLKLDASGKILKEYPSLAETLKQTGHSNSTIYEAIKFGKPAYGCFWKYKNASPTPSSRVAQLEQALREIERKSKGYSHKWMKNIHEISTNALKTI